MDADANDGPPNHRPTGATDRLAAIRPPVRPDDRLTVRHRLDDGSATDVIGWVLGLDADTIELTTGGDPADDDRRVRVARDRIILAKRVPPARGGRPPSRHTAEEVERAAAMGWIDQTEPLGDWILRFGAGFTSRANSCAAIGDPGLPYAEAARITVDRYRARGLQPRALVIAGSQTEDRLRELSWTDDGTATTVMAVTLVDLIGDHRRTDTVTVHTELTDRWWQAYRRYRTVSAPEPAGRMLTGPQPVGLAELTDHGRVISIGRGQVRDDWLGLSALWTAPEDRRRGHATAIIIELALWAARYGARNAYLQVASANTGAIDAYTRLGFGAHHEYRYLTPSAVTRR
jgi:N-acetylglutamate synthase